MSTGEQTSVAALLTEAVALHNRGELARAEAIYWRVLRIEPGQPDALHLLGVLCHQLGRFDKALEFFAQVLQHQPRFTEAWINLGSSQFALRQFEAAVASYDRAIALEPERAAAWNNRGNALARLQRYDAALADFGRAIALKPDWDAPWCNRASKLLEVDRLQEALADFDCALRLNPQLVHARFGRALARLQAKNFQGALDDANAALALQPRLDFLPGLELWTRQHLAAWRQMDERRQAIRQGFAEGRMPATPMHLLAISDDPALQQRAAELFASSRFPSQEGLPQPAQTRTGKIRIGYFSPDFGEHPVSRLLVEIFEQHDRAQFEVYGFGWGSHVAGPLRDRVRAAFDHFEDVEALNEEELLQRARALQLDIAVDLCGFTLHNRTGIFARRVAPVQVNYLGYPATMGAPYIDYLIADEVVIPAAESAHYSEKIVRLPDCFQANAAPLHSAAHSFTRASEGLPAEGFVYCNFNNPSKITPEVFAVWMRVLGRVPASVLWLFAGDEATRANLRHAAEACGVAAERLFFAGLLSYGEHLQRQQLADLFLDTLPFNAGATASPALWAGLPVLTCPGRAFAARMGASLLHAVGLPELIAPSLAAYEDLAVQLATEPGRMALLRQKLAANLQTAPLFDVSRYTRSLESAYRQMALRSRAGLAPEEIAVQQTVRS